MVKKKEGNGKITFSLKFMEKKPAIFSVYRGQPLDKLFIIW